jgi:hypothetical protein
MDQECWELSTAAATEEKDGAFDGGGGGKAGERAKLKNTPGWKGEIDV